jgi:hypothetical protein
MQDPIAAVFLFVIIGLVLFFPLAGDPLCRIPPERLALWPLTSRERAGLRAISVWLNPMSWVIAVLLVWKRVRMDFWLVVAALFAAGFAAPWRYLGSGLGVFRRIPGFPTRLNHLIRKNLRETLSTLDFYAAGIVAAPAACARAAGLLPPEALLPLTMLIMLLFSTCALSLFGLEGEGAFARYRLLPLSGWEILAAKDAVFLLVSLAFTLPLDPAAGLAAALMALALGHISSVRRHGGDERWRFQTSDSFAASFREIVLMLLAAGATARWPLPTLVLCLAAYALSTWRCSAGGRFLPPT